MILPILYEHSYIVVGLISICMFTLLLTTIICIGLYVSRTRRRRRAEIILANKRLIYSSPASITPQIPNKATDRFVFPLPKIESTQTYPQYPLTELSSPAYKTFDLSKQRSSRFLSSDSSYTTSSNPLPTLSFDAVKSKIVQIQRQSTPSPVPAQLLGSDSDGDESESSSVGITTSSFEYSLTDLFRIDLIYKLYYSIEDNQLIFQLVRFICQQTLIEQCFPVLICKIRLYTNESKHKTKKYFSKKNPINEIFKFDLDQYRLEQSYLKVYVFGQHKNDKRLELGQIALVLNQYENLMIRVGKCHDGGLEASQQHIKSIPINEDRIDLITQQQMTPENEARALICLVYENDRCLLHVGLIKIIGIHALLKPTTGHIHHRDAIQIKICTIIDGKVAEKKKSKSTPINKNSLTFSTSFRFDYLSLDKTSVRITIAYRKTLISAQSKPISIIEFGSTHLKNQQLFQHWTDTLAEPNRPHVQWHVLQSTAVN